jgi:hypothetical protein
MNMPGFLRRLLPLALFALPLLPMSGTVGAEAPAPSVQIVQNHPTLFGQLGHGDAVFLRLSYSSETPLRFRLEGYAEGKRVTESRSNPAPIYPAGQGEALVWMAYESPAAIDEVKIIVLDVRWQALAVKVARARLRWENGGATSNPTQPEWLIRLNQEQQAMASKPEPKTGDETESWFTTDMVVTLAWAAVIAYLVLQAPMAIWFAGKWRWAARAPLIATVPVLLYSIGALAAGSALWPLALLMLSPFALVYLVGLLAARLLAYKLAA